jgi:Ni,Fe-hydrogenase III large subunit
MTILTTGLSMTNGQAVSLHDLPLVSLAAFREAVTLGVQQGWRIAALFGQEQEEGVRIFAVLADDANHGLSVLTTDVHGSYPALTPLCPQAHLFEREIWEQTGVEPEGHPWLKAVRRHDFGTHAKDASHPFFEMRSDEVHEVAVGPVHAGIIEPGHFRFQCHGETVHHLEIHLGYQRRGIEETLTGGPHKRTLVQIETVAGDTTAGHTTAYSQALEALSGIEAPLRAQALRVIALELERLANHVGDIGALSNDVGFLPTASFCGRLRGEFLNMTALVCGSRLGRGLVRPGGVAYDMDARLIEEVLRRLTQAERDVAAALDLFFGTDSVLGRLEGTGPVSEQACRDLGIVGVAARASGCVQDIRRDHPFGWHQRAAPPVASWDSGDVFARAMVRKLEIERSTAFIREQLQALPPGPGLAACPPLGPNRLAVSMVEGWRGEIVHVAITGGDGRFQRYKIVDPSFHNWPALALAMRGQQVSDFPLCNKSFNLSYCGFDL